MVGSLEQKALDKIAQRGVKGLKTWKEYRADIEKISDTALKLTRIMIANRVEEAVDITLQTIRENKARHGNNSKNRLINKKRHNI